MEAVCWHNVTPKDDKTTMTASVKVLYTHRICVKGIDEVVVPNNAVANL